MLQMDILYIYNKEKFMEILDRTARSCCILGHREISESEELRMRLFETLTRLITDNGVDTFLFGSKSRFNSLCYGLVTELKEIYPHIQRIYVRGEFPVIDEGYHRYLLERYEDTFYPQEILGAGRSVYIERNCVMINNSQFCLFYCLDGYTPEGRKSGTKLALEYAKKQNKTIYCFP